MTTLLTELTAILRKMLSDNDLELAATTRFEDITGWDDMDLVAVVVEIECRHNLQFELNEMDRLVTIGDFMAMIAVKQALISV